MDRRTLLAFTAALALAGPASASASASASAAVDMDAVARTALGNASTSEDKVRAAVSWTHDNMDWTATDYQNRTVEQIVERKGGNCNDQALVVRAILDRAGVKTRRMREVMIQPLSVERQKNAEELVARMGPQGSVFGLQHNDHVWIEYWDAQRRAWEPADPTIGLVGWKAWTELRMGFGERPHHEMIPYQDMLAPIGIVAMTGDSARPWEDRTDHYLVRGFALFVPEATRTKAWRSWTKRVRAEAPHVQAAFDNRYDLHRDEASIEALRRDYVEMRTEARAKAPSTAPASGG